MNRWLSIGVFAVASVCAANPGLIGMATDRELTVHFVSPTPQVSLTGSESIHPQLKSSFSGDFSGFLIVSNTTTVTLSGARQILVDGKDVTGRPTLLPAGHRKLRIPFKRIGTDPLRISLLLDGAPVPATAFAHEKPPRELKENESRDNGRFLFESHNCGACHRPEAEVIRFTPIDAAPGSKPLGALRPTEGCLAESPEDQTGPRFSFTDREREALQLFVQTPDISPAPLQDLPRLLTQLNCRECHPFHASARTAQDPPAPPLHEPITGRFEEAMDSHLMKRYLTNLPPVDLGRLAALFTSQVATNHAKP